MKLALRALFLLFALLWADASHAASKFLVLCATSCTWDNTNDAIWSTSSGGLNNTTHPIAGDVVTLDANSCVGGVTCTITGGAVTISATSLTWGACTASTTGCIIDWSVNNTNITVSGGSGNGINGAGTGTRKWLCGTGTFTFSTTNNNETFWDLSTTTNLDAGSVFNTCAMTANGSSTANTTFAGGGKSYGTVTFAASIGGVRTISSANTFATLVVAAGNVIAFPNSTTTITNAPTWTGTSANPIAIRGLANVVATLAIPAGSTGTWMTIEGVTFTGNTFVATNSLNIGRVTNATITVPATGGGGRIIGG